MQAIPLFMALLNLLTCFMVFYSVKIYYSENDDGYKWRIEPYQDRGGSWMVLFKDTCEIDQFLISLENVYVMALRHLSEISSLLARKGQLKEHCGL